MYQTIFRVPPSTARQPLVSIRHMSDRLPVFFLLASIVVILSLSLSVRLSLRLFPFLKAPRFLVANVSFSTLLLQYLELLPSPLP